MPVACTADVVINVDADTLGGGSDSGTTTAGCPDPASGCACMVAADCGANQQCIDGVCVDPTANCGDGALDPGEQCDDGPMNAWDGWCKPDCTVQSCGDGILGAGEQCDQPGEARPCADFGYMSPNEVLCNAMCQLDLWVCQQGQCGNGQLEAGEACDGSDLGGATCESLGYPPGPLGCHPMCVFDVGQCGAATVCGDGIVQPGEACDDGNGVAGDGCDPSCQIESVCGDGLRQPIEACDGPDLGMNTCESLGFMGGALACDPMCNLDTAGCM
jgi:cysteine-rich repeat protein